jgi:hypothetical protein
MQQEKFRVPFFFRIRRKQAVVEKPAVCLPAQSDKEQD